MDKFVILSFDDKIDDLRKSHNLKLIGNNDKWDESVIMIKYGGNYVGYILFDPSKSMIKKFEVVEQYQCMSIGTQALKLLFNLLRPYTDKVYIQPRNKSLFDWYKRLDFKILETDDAKMYKEL